MHNFHATTTKKTNADISTDSCQNTKKNDYPYVRKSNQQKKQVYTSKCLSLEKVKCI
jgi:hypothetical protein